MTQNTPSQSTPAAAAKPPLVKAEWKEIIARYQGPDLHRSIWQLVSTMALLIADAGLAYYMLDKAWWVSALLVVVAAGLFTRIFIFMHDCGHGSFTPWPTMNDAIGFITGVLTFTPYAQWRREHALHHASSGDLDRRGYGDINTLTVAEYLALSKFERVKYRLYRHPAVLLLAGPLHLMILQRFRTKGMATKDMQLSSVWLTNIALASLMTLLILTVDYKLVVFIWIPAFYLAGAIGVWLFYVQHQFEDAYWESKEEWDYATAAVYGSSYLRLPKVLQWFSGNIGLHHVHHLGPRIPNYKLQQAHEENPIFHNAPVMTLAKGIKVMGLALWDEQAKRMVRFRDLRQKRSAT
jgi:omega-6 fatty acid desaturase (delta-12 desaturase)